MKLDYVISDLMHELEINQIYISIIVILVNITEFKKKEIYINDPSKYNEYESWGRVGVSESAFLSVGMNRNINVNLQPRFFLPFVLWKALAGACNPCILCFYDDNESPQGG